MPTVTIRYRLPDEQAEYDAARLGNRMQVALWDIDQRLRALLSEVGPGGLYAQGFAQLDAARFDEILVVPWQDAVDLIPAPENAE